MRALASRERSTDILAFLEENFKVTVDRKALSHYDPRLNPKLDDDLKSLYERTAAEFWDKKHFEALNSLNFRQRLRQELYEASGRNLKLKLEILDAAAKDEGGLFSNRREVTGADGAPVVSLNVENVAMASAQDLARVLAEFPLDMIAPDVAAHMINKGWVPAARASEAGLECVDGQWAPRREVAAP